MTAAAVVAELVSLALLRANASTSVVEADWFRCLLDGRAGQTLLPLTKVRQRAALAAAESEVARVLRHQGRLAFDVDIRVSEDTGVDPDRSDAGIEPVFVNDPAGAHDGDEFVERAPVVGVGDLEGVGTDGGEVARRHAAEPTDDCAACWAVPGATPGDAAPQAAASISLTHLDGVEAPSAYDADAATLGLIDRGAIRLDESGQPRAEATVVDARFAGGPFVVDTSTAGYPDGSHRVVVLGVPGLGDIDLFPHEAIDLARALLARVRFAQSALDVTGA